MVCAGLNNSIQFILICRLWHFSQYHFKAASQKMYVTKLQFRVICYQRLLCPNGFQIINKTIRTAEWNASVSRKRKLIGFDSHCQYECINSLAPSVLSVAGWRPVISAQLSTFLELWTTEHGLYQQGADSSFAHYAENKLWYPLKMHPIKKYETSCPCKTYKIFSHD